MAHRYDIQVVFQGGLTPSQQVVFETAADAWSRIITADVPNVRIGDTIVDDIVIFAQGTRIDGEAGILGQAGPIHLRPGSLLPATGMMEFDTADLSRMENNGSLLDVIVHEMGHVLGIGTLWELLDLLQGAGGANPVFIGDNAMGAFAELIGAAEPTPVPLANTGGPGTREGHWRESVFGNELMTGFLNLGANPLSRLTVASLEDLGYQVDLTAAEPFDLPSALGLAIMGIGGQGLHRYECCCMCGRRGRGGGPIVLPEDAVVRRQTKKSRKEAKRK